MSQDNRAKLHALIDAYYDNVDGQYDGAHIDVVIERNTDAGIGDAIDLEVVELVPDWDGRTDGVHGLIKPNAVYINGQRVMGRLGSEFRINIDPDFTGLVDATMTLFVRNLVVRKRDKHMTDKERAEHRELVADVLNTIDGAQ